MDGPDLYPDEFTVVVDRGDDADVVRVTGDLDMATVTELNATTYPLLERDLTLVIDLGGLSFVDSAGLNYFLQLQRASQRDGFTFSMRRQRPAVFRTFEMTALDTVLPWAD